MEEKNYFFLLMWNEAETYRNTSFTFVCQMLLFLNGFCWWNLSVSSSVWRWPILCHQTLWTWRFVVESVVSQNWSFCMNLWVTGLIHKQRFSQETHQHLLHPVYRSSNHSCFLWPPLSLWLKPHWPFWNISLRGQQPSAMCLYFEGNSLWKPAWLFGSRRPSVVRHQPTVFSE